MLLNRSKKPGLILQHCSRYLTGGNALPTQPKVLYVGKLTDKIIYLKAFSIASSMILLNSYSFIIFKKGFTVGIASFGALTSPFLLSPVLIAWFLKGYIIELKYDPITDKYSALKFGYLFGRRTHIFGKHEVSRPNLMSMFSSFHVGKESFFLNEEDLIDAESVELYKSLLGLNHDDQNK